MREEEAMDGGEGYFIRRAGNGEGRGDLHLSGKPVFPKANDLQRIGRGRLY